MMYDWGGLGWDWAAWLMMAVWWVFVALVIIWAVRYLANSSNEHHQHPAAHEAPLDALKRRYAKGEIDKQEFEQIKKDIQ